MPTISIGHNRPAAGPSAPGALLILGTGFAVVLAFLIVHASVAAAVAVLLLPLAAWLLSRPAGGVGLGLVIALTIPYWLTAGAPQVTALRAAAIAATFGLLANRRFRLQWPDFLIAAFAILIVLGWVLQYPQPGVGRFVTSELTPLGFYVGARALAGRDIARVMLIAVLAGTLGALTVIYEYLHGWVVFADPVAYAWNATDSQLFRASGVFGSPPGASTVLCFVLIFGLGCATVFRSRIQLLIAICVAVSAFALFSTFTRAGLIAAGVGVIVFLWLVRSPLLRPTRVAWLTALILIFTLVLVPRLEGSSFVQEGFVRPGNLTAREGYWQTALPIVTTSPHNLIFGIGTGTIEAPLISAHAVVPSALAQAPVVYEKSVHNQYVSTLVEQGLLGLALLALFLGSVLAPLVRRARRNQDPVAAALAASLVGLTIMMIADTVLNHGPSVAMMMTAAGLGVNLSARPDRRGAVSAAMAAVRGLQGSREAGETVGSAR